MIGVTLVKQSASIKVTNCTHNQCDSCEAVRQHTGNHNMNLVEQSATIQVITQCDSSLAINLHTHNQCDCGEAISQHTGCHSVTLEKQSASIQVITV